MLSLYSRLYDHLNSKNKIYVTKMYVIFFLKQQLKNLILNQSSTATKVHVWIGSFSMFQIKSP